MIVIVGLGALGSHAAQALRNMKQGLRVVDFDRIEAKNLLAQFHTRMNARQNKATAMRASLNGLWQVNVDAIPHRLTPENATQILGGATLVIDCTDNLKARQCQRDFCKANGIPLLHGALSADGSFARIIWSKYFVPDEESGDGATCEDGENLPFHMLIGSFLAQTAKVFLTSGKMLNYQITPGAVTAV